MRALSQEENLALALTAFEDRATPKQIFEMLRSDGKNGLLAKYERLGSKVQDQIAIRASELSAKDIAVVFWGEPNYPARLETWASGMPIMFYWGNSHLFDAPSIGMCGSRAASELGLHAAQACGEEVCEHELAIVSGYAKGVDTETHLAALRNGGKTVIVLAEGFDHFRIKRSFPRELFRRDNVLVVSQFSPSQVWNAGAAMSRNRIIFGLGLALVVIEAGDKGGTLAAGQGALRAGRPVYVLDFNGSTPPGNRMLLSTGGIPVSNRVKLGQELGRLVRSEQRFSQPKLLDVRI